MTNYSGDQRIVMTLDAGGTSFRFSAMRAGKSVTETTILPSSGGDLDQCLANLREGFARVKSLCPVDPVAISFAFPGPADYPNGIIGDLPNLPAFRGGVALGPMLGDHFQLPVFVNNDGDLFTLGEAMAGFLPRINRLLANAGSSRRYKNLLGITLGTGFGGGMVCDGRLLVGDNSLAGEVWLLRNKLHPETNAEEGASIRAVRRVYATQAGIRMEQAPDPREIFEIGMGLKPGHRGAAQESFRELGEVTGDAMAACLTLFDSLAVMGGGLSSAAPLFLPALTAELNGTYSNFVGNKFPRLVQTAFNLEDPAQLGGFLKDESREIAVPGGQRLVKFDPHPRTGVGLSTLGTSEAVALGAYAFALTRLDAGHNEYP